MAEGKLVWEYESHRKMWRGKGTKHGMGSWEIQRSKKYGFILMDAQGMGNPKVIGTYKTRQAAMKEAERLANR